MKKIYALLVTLAALLVPQYAQAQSGYPPGTCAMWGGGDDLNTSSPYPWTPLIGGYGTVTIGPDSRAATPPDLANLFRGPTSPPGSWVAIEKTRGADSNESFLFDNICHAPVPPPGPVAPWCTVFAYAKPPSVAVTNGTLEVYDTSYNLFSLTSFTLAKGAPWSPVSSGWLSNCPKDMIVRIKISGKTDWVLIDNVNMWWYY